MQALSTICVMIKDDSVQVRDTVAFGVSKIVDLFPEIALNNDYLPMFLEVCSSPSPSHLSPIAANNLRSFPPLSPLLFPPFLLLPIAPPVYQRQCFLEICPWHVVFH